MRKFKTVTAATLVIAVLMLLSVNMATSEADTFQVTGLKPETPVYNIHGEDGRSVIDVRLGWTYIGSFEEAPWTQYSYLKTYMAPCGTPWYQPPCQAVYFPPPVINWWLRIYVFPPSPYLTEGTLTVDGETYYCTQDNLRLIAFPCNADGVSAWILKPSEWDHEHFRIFLIMDIQNIPYNDPPLGTIQYSFTLSNAGDSIATGNYTDQF